MNDYTHRARNDVFFKFSCTKTKTASFRRGGFLWRVFLLYSGSSRMVAERAAWAPITKTCAMSAVFEGPLIKVP